MLTIITLTGARPEGFALLCKWMKRQTYKGKVRWIVVDDCDPITPISAPKGWIVDWIRPADKWREGMNTQARNMREALSVTPDDAKVLFIEDDDWYAPDYLEVMDKALTDNDIVGQSLSRKWNINSRMARESKDRRQASLCCTGVKGRALSRFRSIAQRGPRLMDIELWRSSCGLLLDGCRVVSLKCLPGRGGIDSGHRANFGDISDPDGEMLREWIGEDADEYLALTPREFRKPLTKIGSRRRSMGRTRDGEIARYVEAHDDPKRRMHMGARRKADVVNIIGALPAGSLLDVGTGEGEALAIAENAGHTARGCDANPKVANDKVVTCAAHELPFDDGSFDHVTCFDVLEHLIEEDIRPALREMSRVARKTVTVSASERPSPDGRGGDFHISKRPKAAWLRVIRECWGADAKIIGTAGSSPAFQVVKKD